MEESGDGNYSMDHDDGFVAIANELLAKFHLSPIQDISQCTGAVLVALYEGILGARLRGSIANPITREDEIHNMQLVIDSLQHDVLRSDLSHITGEAIVDGNLVIIRYLIEILAGLLEHIMENIDSEGSTDIEVDTTDDPDLLTSGTISSISRMLPDDYSTQSSLTRGNYRRAPATATRPDDDEDDDDDRSSTSTNELIRVGESAASAYGPNSSVDVLESGEYPYQ
ncbi:uncharacterized protein [Amphiura filiformis]|uniref:uncharacterized protein n=1 Tax=Amphiura filiformis TaxID=82378 RepID=UPI003B216AC8